jgi:hypothetical protein
MKDIDTLCRSALIILIYAIVVFSSGSWALEDESGDSRSLVLDIYADDAGKALLTGYASGIEGLAFLNGSEYQYDEEALQLYAVTNALTTKNGDDWEIRLPATGGYGEYHITFYLSENVQISEISGTEGLDYLVSSSSDSFVVEFHGYDVSSPSAAVRYRQPLKNEMVGAQAAEVGLQPPARTAAPLILLGLLLLALVVIFGSVKSRGLAGRTSDGAGPEDSKPQRDLCEVDDLRVEGADGEIVPEDGGSPPPSGGAIAPISGEMTAVMETLTGRERSVLEVLIRHQGKMTQAEIRYETGIPKSSLTGIIVSLERRNIVTKREWGRTNVIELSERLTGGGR